MSDVRDILPLLVGAVASVKVDLGGVPIGDQGPERAVLSSVAGKFLAACPHPQSEPELVAYRAADAWLALTTASHPRSDSREVMSRWKAARDAFEDTFGPFGGGGVAPAPGTGKLDPGDVVSEGEDIVTEEGGYRWHTDGRPPEPLEN